MPLPAGLPLRLLVLGTLVAPVFGLKFDFTSPQQCSPLLLSFTGLASPPSGAPASLAIIPFNSTAKVISLQNIDLTAGIGLNFLPLVTGSQFIMSLDDAKGNNIINTSDIFSVLSSPNNNSTCIPEPQPSFFTLATPEVSQCRDFTINYNTTVVSRAPSVRLFSPSGPSFILNVTSDDPTSGMATYSMAFLSGSGIILAIDDGNGITETTSLLLVQGNSSSPSDCLLANSTYRLSSNSVVSSATSSTGISLTPRIVVIVSASIGGAAVLLASCLTIFYIRDRRRYRRQVTQFDKSNKSVSSVTDSDSHNEKGTNPQVILLDNPYPIGSVKTPVDNSDLSSEKGYYDNISLASWSRDVPEEYSPLSGAKQPRRPTNHFSPDSPTVYQRNTPTITRSLSNRHLRAPSDVPADLNSRCSTVSTESFYPSVCETEAKNPPSSVNTPSLRGLPATPRDGLRGNISRAPSRATSKRSIASPTPSTKEWSGRTFTR